MKLSWHALDENTGEAAEGTVPSFFAVLDDVRRRSPAIVTARGRRPGFGGPDGLNLSFRVGADVDSVRTNREAVFNRLDLREDRLAWPEQVHGGTVLLTDTPGEYKAADGLVISNPGLWTAILVADCTPVFVFSGDFAVVGLAHAGREGTRVGITRNLIAKIKSAFRLPPTNWLWPWVLR